MDLVVQSPDELLSAVPHVLGFRPEESIVLVPFRPGLPIVRLDLPTTARDRDKAWDAVSGPYGRHARPGAVLAVLCFTEDRRSAGLASQHMSNRLDGIGINTHIRLWTDGRQWCEFNTGHSGLRNQTTAERIATTTVLAGAPQPAASRASMAASMVGDRDPITQLLPAARTAAAASTPTAEREWALDRVEQFHADGGGRLSNVDGARLLVALETIGTRDALWEDMNRENRTSHMSLWHDLTRRAPDELRAAPASMLGFASWLHGDGARAWCALDQVPDDRPYSMAALVASALQNGIHPQEWDRYQTQERELAGDLADTAGGLDESFVPRPATQHRDLPYPQRPTTDRPAPGR
ncbi:DUF4192 domain-containing protein [Nocardioides currus]|uniref:DUF4192 domain-containing protein n=1 Tax=Nocardioides currus TaxID=2133958 RepID=A0A2R7YXH4_9ACTN|nr:DUF4192 domain-containing protein [Nocardioides currus]PUA81065.1 hypothetical protein C7S10_11870 [Nocardioides currus]